EFGNRVRSLLWLLPTCRLDADTEMKQEKFEAAMILATYRYEMEISEIEAKKGATQVRVLIIIDIAKQSFVISLSSAHFIYASDMPFETESGTSTFQICGLLDSGDVVELTQWDEMARELKPIFLFTPSTLSTHLIAPAFAGTPETTTPLQLTRGTSRSLKILAGSQTPASPKSTRNEEFENLRGAIEQSNKATKRTLFPKEPEDQKKTE
ncbi:hypothetical protein Tco_1280741, partial [Tanacetum coccineum]